MISVKNRRKWYIKIAAVGVLVFAGIGIFYMVPEAKADVVLPGSGTSNSPSGCNRGGIAGCPWTSNGFGWRQISVDAPNGPNGNGRWPGAVAACRGAGATDIMAFVVLTGERTQQNAWVYNYNVGFRIGWPGYDGTISPSEAERRFNTLSAAARSGYSFGSNVGMFCWNLNPPWNVNLRTTVNKTTVEPGERITWTHTLRNAGPNRTNQTILWRYISSGGISGEGTNWSWASGAAANTESVQTSTYDVLASDAGRIVCRSARAAPSTNTSSVPVFSTPPTCVLVAKKPKVQILGSDLIIGRTFSGTSVISGTNTNVTEKIVPAGVVPPYESSMITGLQPTGVSASGAKLSPGAEDPHWQLSNVYRANANGNTLIPASADSRWRSTDNRPTCQPGPYPRPATVINTNLVDVGINEAWKTSLPGSAWIGAYDDANNLGNSGSCVYPGMSQTLDQATFARGSIWAFKLTNDFMVDARVDPATVRLNMNLSADDEVQILVNGQTVAEPSNFRRYGTWPSTPVTYTTNPSAAFKNGANTLEIRLKSAWQYTGFILNSISVAQASLKPVIPGNVFGSWVEYGIFATGRVNGTGSGAAFAGTGGKNAAPCDYSLLSLVNATTSIPARSCSTNTTIGRYETGRAIPDIASNFPVQTGITPVFDNNAARPQGLYTSANNLTIGNATTPKVIAKGQWAIINAPNVDVTIAGDIVYDGVGLTSIGDIPQLVIIARNIYINPNVTNVDAWLIAKSPNAAEGVIDTCRISTTYTTRLTTSVCAEKLTVNGPVMTQHLWLRRTAGSGVGAQTGDPAEVFNLRPDAYMWGFARASTNGRINSVYSKELPPRF